MPAINIMLVEDNPEFREVVAFTLSDAPDIELQSQFSSAELALRSLEAAGRNQLPTLILLDLNLPGMSGIEAIPWFKQSAPNAEIIILTQSDSEADVLAAITAGASGYLLKEATLNQIKDGIRSVSDGGAVLDPAMAKFLTEHHKKSPPVAKPEKLLSSREMEVLHCIAEGKLQKEVADELKISPKTIETHIRHIYEKLQVQNAPAAVAKAYKFGIFPQEK